MREDLIRTIALWTVGLLGGIIFRLLKLFGQIVVDGYDKGKLTPPDDGVMYLVHNHPSLWEVFVLPFILFFPYYLFDLKFIPYSLPDRTNYGQIWFSFFKPFVIPLERREQGKLIGDIRSLLRSIKKIKILTIAPGGGRDFKGKEFKFIGKGGQIVKGTDWGQIKDTTAKIRVFERGITFLIERSQAKIVPIWVDLKKDITPNPVIFPKYPYFLFYRFWRKARIKIGEPITGKVKAEDLEDILLRLSQT